MSSRSPLWRASHAPDAEPRAETRRGFLTAAGLGASGVVLASTATAARALEAGGVQAVDSLAALLSVTPALDEVRVVRGYHEADDGCGGLFIFRAASRVEEDGGTVFRRNAGAGRWHRYLEGGGVHAGWFGLRSDAGTTLHAPANSLALQRAVDHARAAGAPLVLGPGVFHLDDPISIEDVSGLRITGAGSRLSADAGTELRWVGPAFVGGKPSALFDLRDVRECHFADFLVSASRSHPLGVGFRSQNRAGGRAPTANSFERIRINGTDGGLGKGFEFSHAEGIDENNSEMFFLDCGVFNFGEAGGLFPESAGWSFESSQSKAHTFVNCHFGGYPPARSRFGVSTRRGGSFRWYGGNGNNVDVCFALGSPNDTTVISGVNSEGCGRLLETGSTSSAPSPVLLEGVRFSCDRLAEDRRIVDFRWSGPLQIRGCLFDGNEADTAGVIFVRAHAGYAPSLIAIGNAIGTIADPAFEIAGPVRTFLAHNVRRLKDGPYEFLPDALSAGVATGPGAARPVDPAPGEAYFDADLGRPVWWNADAGAWVDAGGAPA